MGIIEAESAKGATKLSLSYTNDEKLPYVVVSFAYDNYIYNAVAVRINVAANGGQGVRIVWQAMSSNKPLELLSLDVDYPTLFIYQSWQYDTELFTRLVADAGFPHLCKYISIGQNAVSFIDWSATEEKE